MKYAYRLMPYMLLLLSVPVMALQSPPAETQQAPTQEKQKDDARIPVVVADDVRVIEEASLIPDGALARRASSKAAMADMKADAANAARMYAFRLAPKEKLKIKLKADDNQIIMSFAKPAKADDMSSAIKRANLPPTPIRRSSISIENPYDAPREAVLLLIGLAGHKFRMDIERGVK